MIDEVNVRKAGKITSMMFGYLFENKRKNGRQKKKKKKKREMKTEKAEIH